MPRLQACQFYIRGNNRQVFHPRRVDFHNTSELIRLEDGLWPQLAGFLDDTLLFEYVLRDRP